MREPISFERANGAPGGRRCGARARDRSSRFVEHPLTHGQKKRAEAGRDSLRRVGGRRAPPVVLPRHGAARDLHGRTNRLGYSAAAGFLFTALLRYRRRCRDLFVEHSVISW